MKLKRSVLIPAALLVYLAVLAVPGYSRYADGEMVAVEYFGILAVSVAAIVALHFTLRRRERLRAEREEDIRRSEQTRREHKDNDNQ